MGLESRCAVFTLDRDTTVEMRCRGGQSGSCVLRPNITFEFLFQFVRMPRGASWLPSSLQSQGHTPELYPLLLHRDGRGVLLVSRREGSGGGPSLKVLPVTMDRKRSPVLLAWVVGRPVSSSAG